MAKNGNDDGLDGEDGGEGQGGREDQGGDYEVGYGKPPKHTQFKKGLSGNPGGPKKGSRGLKKDLHKALEAKHSIKVSGKVVRGTTQELALFTLATRAAAGDLRATKQLTDLVLQVFGPEDRGRDRKTLPKQDQELLDRLLDEISWPDEGDPGGGGNGSLGIVRTESAGHEHQDPSDTDAERGRDSDA